jgi:hypothetical protein
MTGGIIMNCDNCKEALVEHSQLLDSKSLKAIIIYNLCPKCGQRFDLLGYRIAAHQIEDIKTAINQFLT